MMRDSIYMKVNQDVYNLQGFNLIHHEIDSESIELIGSGQYAKIFRALLKNTDITVAIKLIVPKNRKANNNTLELYILNQLNSINKTINVPRVFYTDQEDQHTIIIMDYFNSSDLFSYLNK